MENNEVNKNKILKNKAFRALAVVLAASVCFAIGFICTTLFLNKESYSEESQIYIIEQIDEETDNTYSIKYYNVNQNEEDNKDYITETLEIDEFLEPESNNIGVSYIREIKKENNSFLNYLFKYDNNIIIEKDFYITELDKLKLEENGTTDILDLDDIKEMYNN